MKVAVPPPSALVFQNGISHPDLWLWDSWTLWHGQELHLYCLALSRSANGVAITPADRNNHAFHVRHFISTNDGQSWRDLGAVLGAGQIGDGSDARNVWSGSVSEIAPSKFLFAHTGIRSGGDDQPFIQSVNVCPSSSPDVVPSPQQALLCPVRDYDQIKCAGYYLGPADQLGHGAGEEGGPILAWRDPHIYVDGDGEIHIFISAKIAPKTPAIAHGLLKIEGDRVELKSLLPPIELPDAEAFTQAEVPKIYRDEKRDLYYLLIAACDRLYEGQPDCEVAKQHRLYKATQLCGPWAPYHKAGSLLPNMSDLFGASLMSADFDTGEFQFVAPYTEMAPYQNQLTFAPICSVNIYEASDTRGEKLA